MPFGKFKGWLITAVDDEYLRWLRGLDLREPLRGGVEAEWRRRFGDVPAQSTPPQSAPPATRPPDETQREPIRPTVLAADVRALAHEVVNDGARVVKTRIGAAGDPEETEILNEAVAALRRFVEDGGQLTTAGTTR